MPEADGWVAVVFSSFRLPAPLCLQILVQMARNPRHTCYFSLVLTIQTSRAEALLSFLMGRGEKLCVRFLNAFFPNTHWEFLSRKASVQPVSSSWNPTFPPGGEPACKDIINGWGETCLSFTAGLWVARATSHCLHPVMLGTSLGGRELGVRNTLCL